VTQIKRPAPLFFVCFFVFFFLFVCWLVSWLVGKRACDGTEADKEPAAHVVEGAHRRELHLEKRVGWIDVGMVVRSAVGKHHLDTRLHQLQQQRKARG
jgi:hypothetical protein